MVVVPALCRNGGRRWEEFAGEVLRRKPFTTAKAMKQRSTSIVDVLKWKCSSSWRKQNERWRLPELVLALARPKSTVNWTVLFLLTFARVSAS